MFSSCPDVFSLLRNDFDTDGKSSLGILNVEDMGKFSIIFEPCHEKTC